MKFPIQGLFLLLLLSFTATNARAQYGTYHKAQYGAYHKDVEFITHLGIAQSDLRYGDNTAAEFGIDFTPFNSPNDMFSISFFANYRQSKDYWSFNPLGGTSMVLVMFCSGLLDKSDEVVKKIAYCTMFESMGLNFALSRHFELSPYWSLLRLSRWHNGATYVTGATGLRANWYFGRKLRWSLRGSCEYSWGYGNSDWWAERIKNIFDDKEEATSYTRRHKPRTPFKGVVYGLSLGYRF